MNFQGTIIAKTEKTEVWEYSTPKIYIVIEEIKNKHSNSIVVACFGDQVDLVKNVAIGSEVAIEYNSKASEHNGKYYQNNSIRKIEILSEAMVEHEEDIIF